MAVSKQKKQEILIELVEKFKNAKSIGFASTNAVTVEEFAKLRKILREVNSSYNLAKKTLLKKALKEALDIDINISDFGGQVGFVCSNDDAIAGLSKLNDFIKETEKEEKMIWVSSVFEGELKNLEETKVIASMPSRETLLGRLVGSMKSPISALVRFFDAASKDLEEKGVDKIGKLVLENKNEVKEDKEIEISKEQKVEKSEESTVKEDKIVNTKEDKSSEE